MSWYRSIFNTRIVLSLRKTQEPARVNAIPAVNHATVVVVYARLSGFESSRLTSGHPVYTSKGCKLHKAWRRLVRKLHQKVSQTNIRKQDLGSIPYWEDMLPCLLEKKLLTERLLKLVFISESHVQAIFISELRNANFWKGGMIPFWNSKWATAFAEEPKDCAASAYAKIWLLGSVMRWR